MIYVNTILYQQSFNVWNCLSSFIVSADSVNCLKIDLTTFGRTRILSMITKQTFTEPETEVKWYFDSIEEIVIVYIRTRLRDTFASNCLGLQHSTQYVVRLRLRLMVVSGRKPLAMRQVGWTKVQACCLIMMCVRARPNEIKAQSSRPT